MAKQPTDKQLKQMMASLQPGQIKHFPQFAMTIKKPKVKTGLDKLGDISRKKIGKAVPRK